MKLHIAGWWRLEVVVTVVWLLGCTLYLAADYHGTLHETATAAWQRAAPPEWHVRGQEGQYFNCRLSAGPTTNAKTLADVEAQTDCSAFAGQMAVLLLSVPVFVGVLPLLVLSLLWIRAGFRDAELKEDRA